MSEDGKAFGNLHPELLPEELRCWNKKRLISLSVCCHQSEESRLHQKALSRSDSLCSIPTTNLHQMYNSYDLNLSSFFFPIYNYFRCSTFNGHWQSAEWVRHNACRYCKPYRRHSFMVLIWSWIRTHGLVPVVCRLEKKMQRIHLFWTDVSSSVEGRKSPLRWTTVVITIKDISKKCLLRTLNKPFPWRQHLQQAIQVKSISDAMKWNVPLLCRPGNVWVMPDVFPSRPPQH